MSHFIADVANPMHTDQSEKEEPIHSRYEGDVDERIRDYRFRYDGRDGARPGARTRRVARVAHRDYWDLVTHTTRMATTASPPHHEAPAQPRRQCPGRPHVSAPLTDLNL